MKERTFRRFNAINMRLFEIDHRDAVHIRFSASVLSEAPKLQAVVMHIALAAFTHFTESLHAV